MALVLEVKTFFSSSMSNFQSPEEMTPSSLVYEMLHYNSCECPASYTDRFEGDEDRSPTSQPDHGLVTVKVRLNNNNLISRVDMPHDSRKKCFIGPICYENFLHWVYRGGPAQQLGVQVGDGCHQSRVTLEHTPVQVMVMG